jgi:hypothetical protein
LLLICDKCRERKYEIGVLRTIEWKKCLNITLCIRTLIVSLFGLVLGAGFGSLVSVPTANKLLEQEITSAQQKTRYTKQLWW